MKRLKTGKIKIVIISPSVARFEMRLSTEALLDSLQEIQVAALKAADALAQFPTKNPLLGGGE